jgi:hypothetical protein
MESQNMSALAQDEQATIQELLACNERLLKSIADGD